MQTILANNLPNIKLSNQSSIRQMIYHHSPISRREIADALNLTLPTITTTVNMLIEKGFLRDIEAEQMTQKKLGRKTSFLDIVADSRFFMGVEMRGAKRRLCITDYRGSILAWSMDDTSYPDYDENIAVTCSMAKKLIAELGEKAKKLSGICFCIPGLVDRENGRLSTHPGYGWREKNVADDIRRLTGFTGPVTIENNTCARAYSAYLFDQGFDDDYSSFAYFYISTGIACPIMDIRYRFKESIIGVGEAGHMVMNTNGPLCRCGNRGCLEAYSSEQAILQTCKMKLDKMPVLREFCDAPEKLTFQDILLAQENGDNAVKQVISEAVIQIGVAIANIDNLIRPDFFLIEGHLFDIEENQKLLLATINQNLYTVIGSKFNFRFIKYNSLSGALGAAAVAIQQDLVTYIE